MPDRPEEPREEQPSTASRIADYIVDEAKNHVIDKVVDTLSGGWLGYDPDDDDEERQPKKAPQKRESFEERLERELAQLPREEELAQNATSLPASVSHSFDQRVQQELARLAAEQTQPETAYEPAPVAPVAAVPPMVAPLPVRPASSPLGFGRKVA